jgi:hypothetical protein
MERTKTSDGVIKWKKIGGGGLHLKGRIIKPGQIFTARLDEIPKAFRDTCLPLEDIKEIETPTIIPVKTSYNVVPRGKSKSLFDVTAENGKVLNEKALTKEIAEQLVKDLEK